MTGFSPSRIFLFAFVAVSAGAWAATTSPSNSSATFGTVRNTNNPITFHIIARDTNGIQLTRGGTTFSVTADGPGSAVYSDPLYVDNGDGSYDGSFTVDRPGTYLVTITLVSDPNYFGSPAQIGGSPYTVLVDGPYAPNCYATDSGVTGGEVNTQLTFVIHAVDSAGNPLTTGGDPFIVSVQNPAKKPKDFTFHDNGDGTYTVTYTPDKPGAWRISITLLGQGIQGSPYRPNISG